jgi:hypothetical protein
MVSMLRSSAFLLLATAQLIAIVSSLHVGEEVDSEAQDGIDIGDSSRVDVLIIPKPAAGAERVNSTSSLTTLAPDPDASTADLQDSVFREQAAADAACEEAEAAEASAQTAAQEAERVSLGYANDLANAEQACQAAEASRAATYENAAHTFLDKTSAINLQKCKAANKAKQLQQYVADVHSYDKISTKVKGTSTPIVVQDPTWVTDNERWVLVKDKTNSTGDASDSSSEPSILQADSGSDAEARSVKKTKKRARKKQVRAS